MKQYKCLTKEPTVASAIYVPYYAGLDVGRYLWDPDGFMRDHDAVNLVKWLAARPEWKKMWGRDHLLVTGRINWDFRRDHKNESDWGNELLNFSESRNVTIFLISGETTHHLRFRFWSRVSRPRPRASPPPRRVPLAFVGRPIETANQETLEALYRQARDAYYSEEPLIVDDMFDRVELKLRCYGLKSVVKYPRGSIRLHSTYADAEEDSSQVLR